MVKCTAKEEVTNYRNVYSNSQKQSAPTTHSWFFPQCVRAQYLPPLPAEQIPLRAGKPNVVQSGTCTCLHRVRLGAARVLSS